MPKQNSMAPECDLTHRLRPLFTGFAPFGRAAVFSECVHKFKQNCFPNRLHWLFTNREAVRKPSPSKKGGVLAQTDLKFSITLMNQVLRKTQVPPSGQKTVARSDFEQKNLHPSISGEASGASPEIGGCNKAACGR